jgi:Sec-independent protein translocase protein TatA
MEIFNIGPWELVLILILALVVFGPERMVDYSKATARVIRKIVRSPFWRDLVSTSEEIKDIPRQIVKEANLEESLQELKDLQNTIRKPLDLSVRWMYRGGVNGTGESENSMKGKPVNCRLFLNGVGSPLIHL